MCTKQNEEVTRQAEGPTAGACRLPDHFLVATSLYYLTGRRHVNSVALHMVWLPGGSVER